MSEQEYLKPAEEIDMAQAERSIQIASLISLLALVGAVPAGYFLIPLVLELPDELPARLAFAAQASALVLLCVVVAVLMVARGRRLSPADIGGSAAGPPSQRIAISVAFLQNTLEQAVIAVGLYFALATLLNGAWLSLIPVGVIFFVIGRILFLCGYARGAPGRALGMTLTLIPTVLGYLLALVLMVSGWF
jgi:uncharacterized membrane protein YecN with MAPEG domain